MHRLLNVLYGIWSTLIQLFSFIVLYLTPISNYVHLVLLLITFDLITGSYASVKEGEKFQAKKLRKTVEKFTFYAMAIIIAYVLQRIINDGTELARIVALYIGSIEVKSNYENISRITKTDLVAIVWNALKNKIESYLTDLKNKANEQN